MATESQTKQGVVRIPTGTWHVDSAHSSVEFEIKHLMIATVRGRFREFDGTIVAAEDVRDSRTFGTVETASVDTNQPDRDAHLRSSDFFDCERYPKARFESTSIEPLGGREYSVRGKLTIKDVTRDVEFSATVDGAQRDPWGNERVGVSARGSIDRKEFGLTWQQALETGGFVLGDSVKIIVDISAVRDADD